MLLQPGCGMLHTFLPSGMAARSISTLAWAKTSAEADMLTRKSVVAVLLATCSPSPQAPNSSPKPPHWPLSVPSQIASLQIFLQQSRFHCQRRWPHTLHSRLRAHRNQCAHSSGHEVLEELGPLLAALIPVRGKRGNFGGFLALALEGAVKGRSRGAAGLHGGAASPRNGQLVRRP